VPAAVLPKAAAQPPAEVEILRAEAVEIPKPAQPPAEVEIPWGAAAPPPAEVEILRAETVEIPKPAQPPAEVEIPRGAAAPPPAEVELPKVAAAPPPAEVEPVAPLEKRVQPPPPAAVGNQAMAARIQEATDWAAPLGSTTEDSEVSKPAAGAVALASAARTPIAEACPEVQARPAMGSAALTAAEPMEIRRTH